MKIRPALMPALPSGNQVHMTASRIRASHVRRCSTAATYRSPIPRYKPPLHSRAQKVSPSPSQTACARLGSGSPCTDGSWVREACRIVVRLETTSLEVATVFIQNTNDRFAQGIIPSRCGVKESDDNCLLTFNFLAKYMLPEFATRGRSNLQLRITVPQPTM